MRKYFIAAVCALTMSLACFLVPMRHGSLAGTWVIYAGGPVSGYDILIFDTDGTGEGYTLPQDYDEVWLQGEPVPDKLLSDPAPFQWRTTGDDQDQLTLTYENGQSRSFDLTYEDDLDRTGLPGITLGDDIGGGGWVQAMREE